MLTKVLAIEWAKKKIRVNAIAPGTSGPSWSRRSSIRAFSPSRT